MDGDSLINPLLNQRRFPSRTNYAMKPLQGHVARFALALAALALDSYFTQRAEAASWTTNSTMLTARGFHTAILLPDGKVLVAGGFAAGRATASTELYHPASGKWTTTGPLKTARYSHTATLLPTGKVLVAGGVGDNGAALSNAETFDPTAGKWTPTDPLSTTRNWHTSTLLPNGQVLVTAGSGVGNTAAVYNPGN